MILLSILLVVASTAAQDCNSPQGTVSDGYPKGVTANWVGVPDSPDCFFQRANGAFYFFKGAQYYKVLDKYILGNTSDAVEDGYPKLIADKWVQGSGNSRIPDSPDACFQRRSTGEIYFFKGTQYWKVSDKYMDPSQDSSGPDSVVAGYPKTVQDRWLQGGASSPLPSKIDAVFQRANYKIYFFSGTQYWRVPDKTFFDLTADQADSGYPKIIRKKWPGLQDNADDIEQRFATNKGIYQFVGSQYYKYNDENLPCPCSSLNTASSCGIPLNALIQGFPSQTADSVAGIPSGVDCFFQRANGNFYYFKGTQYWKVEDKNIQNDSSIDVVSPGYPQLIADKWVQGSGDSRVPDSPDACFQRRSTGEIYFFKANQYWKVADKYMDPSKDDSAPDSVAAGYPKIVQDRWLQGGASAPIPNRIDAVFQRSNFKIYFFAGSQYWRVPDKSFYEVANDVVDSPYPKSIALNWPGFVDGADDIEQRYTTKDIEQLSGSQIYKLTDDDLPCPCPSNQAGNGTCRVAQNSLVPDYPKAISDGWESVFNYPDCVFQRANGQIYFFKGSEYIKVVDKYILGNKTDVVASGYPKLIADKWVQGSGNSRIPDSPDACFQRRGTGEIYFFKGTQYWKVYDKYLDPSQDSSAPDSVAAGYPKLISENWLQGNSSEALPAQIDDVYEKTNFKIYFVAGSKYYRFKDVRFFGGTVAQGDSGYPKPYTSKRGLVGYPDAVEQRHATNNAVYEFIGESYFKYNDDDLPCPCPVANVGTSSKLPASCPTISGSAYLVQFSNCQP